MAGMGGRGYYRLEVKKRSFGGGNEGRVETRDSEEEEEQGVMMKGKMNFLQNFFI